MWMLNQGGFTPWESLRASSYDASISLGMDKDIGSIEVGKLADIVVINGEVLEDIRKSEMISHTMINGRLYNVKDMSEVASGKSKLKPLFFNRLDVNAMPTSTSEALKRKGERHLWVH
jgi:adenine deaminase